MVFGAVSILQYLAELRDIELLVMTKATLLKNEPKWHSLVFAPKNAENFTDYKQLGDLENERSILQNINLTISLTQKRSSEMQMKTVLQSIFKSQLADYGFIFKDLEMMMHSNEDEEATNENAEKLEGLYKRNSKLPYLELEQRAAIINAFNTPKLKDALLAFNRVSTKSLHLRTAVKQMENSLAFLITIVEDVETQSKFDENQANYKLKITGE